ncbi:tryptophan synthase subunit alpha [Alkalicoccus luteus]|uniref:Tryptophan synthase alpha chain n=1 Tax=Alkalicoccus luteus TaxID=1237094 RepID=A0A969TVK4_9BACI|nr:tryptophan synthase subunit alpha [Alkalicoccus luteus]NJP38197.1 tryptophan synthase subunit alpha [Alkalicoccus luteus]
MNRLKQDAFLHAEKRFVPYIMSGHPDYESSVEIALMLERAGAAALEWGVPFSDPLADGPVIQSAGDYARARGASLSKALEGAKEARERGLSIPMILFTYINPVLSAGIDNVLDRMQEAGMDGILIPDLPFEESGPLREAAKERGLSLISLVAPSSRTRMKKISREGDGFIYYVTSLGVTGTRENFSENLQKSIEEVREAAEVPVLAGFGISKPEHVAFFHSIADGVIVGSALVRCISERAEKLENRSTREEALREIEAFVDELTSKQKG